MTGISLIPRVGDVASLVNILFIFRSDRRCIHDLVAGTQVVKVLPAEIAPSRPE